MSSSSVVYIQASEVLEGFFFFSSRRRHTRFDCDWSSDVCSSDLLAARFGADVAELVDGVTKLDQIKFKSREEAQAESFRKMLLAMVRDLRVILVKLADRTHNMRTIEAMTLARRRAIARETLDIYAPIAERLGLYNMKLELEDLGFKEIGRASCRERV